jgi:hypothetical protein
MPARLCIRFLWLPKQVPELSPMSQQLWRKLKRPVAANRQVAPIDALSADATGWVLTLTPRPARRKVGTDTYHFWLKPVVVLLATYVLLCCGKVGGLTCGEG